jgi:SAM-dependent methyltransferase
MDSRWETFAQQDAEFYIYTAPDVDFSSPAGRAFFLQSGRDDAERILREVEPYLTGFGRAVEIGCGVGRLALPMAERFGEVVGVDIAPSMIRKLGEYSREAGVDNVRGFGSDEPWDEQGSVDLAYSFIVFQHIESGAVIADYFRRLTACLDRNGICFVQFDTRPRTAAYFLLRAVPDAVLPRPWRKGIRRVRRRRTDLLRLFESCGLAVLRELQPDSERHVFLLRPRQDRS